MDQDLKELLSRIPVMERLLWKLLRGQKELMSAQNLELEMEMTQMFDVQRLVDAAKRQTDATKAMKDALDKMTADLRAAQDDPDQLEAALTAFEANTAVIAAAATSGTPADTGQPVPPVVDTGGSTGGIRSSTT